MKKNLFRVLQDCPDILQKIKIGFQNKYQIEEQRQKLKTLLLQDPL
jgi:hypothetical protein